MTEHAQNPITVLIIEDHPIYQDALRGYIEIQSKYFALVCCTDNPQTALSVVAESVPDVALVDLELHRDPQAGIRVIAEIRDTSPETKVVVLTAHHENELVFPAIQAGAVAYLLKDNVRGPEVANIIRQVHAGMPPMDPDIAQKLWDYFQGRLSLEHDLPIGLPTLTGREQEVLGLIVEQKSNKEIAQALVISEKTVKTHVSNMLQKLHLSNRTELRLVALTTQIPPS